MAYSDQLPILTWHIPYFDRRVTDPFPLRRRNLMLDWTRLSPPQIAEVLQIVGVEGPSERQHPTNSDGVVCTMSRKVQILDLRILKFRGCFCEPSDEEWKAIYDFSQSPCRSSKNVNVGTEYFEDERGQRITMYEMIELAHGQKDVIILGDAQSVLRLGPCEPLCTEEWDVPTADTIAQFLEVVERICSSAWYRRGSSISFEKSVRSLSEAPTSPSEDKLLQAIFPSDEETMAVLALFRQLHAKDALLAKAADCYMKHCSDARRCWWISERKGNFESTVNSPPSPFGGSQKRFEIIRMFMYGAGMLHAKSDYGQDLHLAAFVREKGREWAVTIFNNCLFDLITVAIPMYHVVRQDFRHWLDDRKLVGPARQEIGKLFQSFQSG